MKIADSYMPTSPSTLHRLRTRLEHSPFLMALAGASFYLALVGYLVRSIRSVTGGRFLYALDDPYIHLSLAEQLAHGHYGINPTDFSSPSSSLIWPFLLIPGVGTRFHAYLPLAWNLLFGLSAALLLGWQVGRCPPQVDDQGRMPWWQQLVTVVLLVLTANLASLTIVGMEHVLQVLLAICCAIGLIRALSVQAIPLWCLAAAVLAPSVRYEDLTLTLAVSLALVGLGRSKRAIAVLALSLAPLVAFSAFLKSKGLPLLPMSVLVKGSAYTQESLPMKLIHLVSASIQNALIEPERFPVVILFLLFAGLAWQARTRLDRLVFAGAAALGGLQLLIGRFGWFYRYEVYAVIFLTLLCLYVVAERPRFLFGYFALGLVLCASSYIKATADTSTAAEEVYNQQFQMHRFVTRFYTGDYAVNDLGLTSFQRRPGAYVLDVYGLASLEAARNLHKSPEWLAGIVDRHHVPLAILYPEWFHIPPAWVPLAKMCLAYNPILLPHPCVVFYSTSPAQQETIRGDLERFSTTLPPRVAFHLATGRDDDAMWLPTAKTPR